MFTGIQALRHLRIGEVLLSLNQLMSAAYLSAATLAIPLAAAQENIAPPGNHPIWRSMGGMPGTDGAVYCSAVDATGNLYVGGAFTIAGNVRSSGVAKWDGANWTSISPPLQNGGTVEAMAIDAQGNLYVGGSFREMGGISALRIAKWDGAQWHAMGTGLGANGVYATQSVKAITIGPGGQIYAGGFFAEAGSTTVNNIARWDGSHWHPLGQGLIDSSPSVKALVFDASGTLYATGRFKWQGDDTPISPSIAKWNGNTWSSLGTGLGGFPYPDAVGDALIFDHAGNLIVAGQFTSAGGVSMKNIARWNGTSWSAFGAGLAETGTGVLALSLTAEGDVLAASKSSIVDDLVHNDLMRWNGSSWVNVIPHSAINGAIRTFQILPNGNYVLGGDFKKLGTGGDTFHANYLVRWDGTRFHRFGNGPNGKVRAAKFAANNDLIVGGDFKTIGDIEASGVARYDGNQWWSMGSGVDGEVHSLALGSGGVTYAGGKFNTAGGVASKSVAMWDGSQWVSMGDGLTQSTDPIVYTLALKSDGALFVGGLISQSVSGVPLSGVARWQDGAWHDLGGGCRTTDGLQPANGIVRSLVIDSQGSLIAGGTFVRMGTTSTTYTKFLARWNGTQWSSVGPTDLPSRPFDNLFGIDSIAMSPSGVLHVGYWSTLTDSHALSRLVSNAWQKIGNGFTGTPHSIAFDDAGGIYAGGLMILTGPQPRHVLRGITYWNGTRWSSLGNEGLGLGNASSDVMALAMDNRGNLVLAGDFFGSSDGVVSPFLIRTRTDDYGLWPALGSLPLDRLDPFDHNGPLGLQNLAAYAMGLDPLQAVPSDLPSLSSGEAPVVAAGSDRASMEAMAADEVSPTMKFRYRHNRQAAGIITQVVASQDLVEWSPAEILKSKVIEEHLDWELIEVTVPSDAGANFLRLAIGLEDDF